MSLTRRALFKTLQLTKLQSNTLTKCPVYHFTIKNAELISGLEAQSHFFPCRSLENPIDFTPSDSLTNIYNGSFHNHEQVPHANTSDFQSLMMGSGSNHRVLEHEIGEIDIDHYRKEGELFMIGHSLDIEGDRTTTKIEYGCSYERFNKPSIKDF